MNESAEDLMQEYVYAQASIKVEKLEFEKNIREKEIQASNIKLHAQSVCEHKESYEEYKYDYHNSTDWTNVVCKLCEKQLYKY